jgi:hypothetical protein
MDEWTPLLLKSSLIDRLTRKTGTEWKENMLVHNPMGDTISSPAVKMMPQGTKRVCVVSPPRAPFLAQTVSLFFSLTYVSHWLPHAVQHTIYMNDPSRH